MESPIDVARVVEQTFVATVLHHTVIDSTNNEARRLAESHTGRPALPLLVVADRQTAGRGRGTNRWWTGNGNLACSVLLNTGTHGVAPPQVPLLSLAAAVAVARTVTPLLGSVAARIHWPNDVYAAGRKLAGVLIEVVSGGYAIVGVGLNVNSSLREAPLEVQQKATTLYELTGKRHAMVDLLIPLWQHFERALDLLRNNPAELARCADRLCGQHGRHLMVHTGHEVLEGTCAGISPAGELLLDTAAGRRRIVSGVVLPDTSVPPHSPNS